MPKILTWDANYSVGDSTLDNQHKKLMGLCNKLAVCSGDDSEASNLHFAEILKELSAYAQEHFTTEEAMLRRCGYPRLVTHQADHAEYEIHIAEVVAAAKQGALDKTGLQVLLSNWWDDHILISDRDYRSHLMAGDAAATSAAQKPALNFRTGAQVRKLREQLGQSENQFWSKIGVAKAEASRYESARSIPKPVQYLLQLTYGTASQSADLLARLHRPADE